MRLRVQTESFTTVLLAALGLSPLGACGGAFATDSSDAGVLGSGGGQAGSSSTTGGAGDIGGSSGVGGDTYPGTGGYIGQGGALVGAGGATPYSCFSGGYAGSGPGLLTGYDRCGNSMIHRTIKKDCASGLPRDIVFQVDGGGYGPGTCSRDADCTAKPHGYCAFPEAFGGPVPPGLSASCSYGCVRDEECGQAQICVCGGGNVPAPIGHCVSSTCTIDAQCGPGLVCGNYNPSPGCPSEAFACQTSADQCAVDSDCKPPNQCTYQNGRRVCSPVACVIGRPFLVGGVERLARRSSEGGWRGHGDRPDVAHIGARDRARLAEAWTKVGLMEHASIAAFARFTLQLMSLGAPADLIERSNAATLDETAHAKLAFGIASTYAGRDVGPGPLDVRGALDESTLESILVNVIREGCIGETVAAVEAAEALEHAVDPAVRRALAQITDDELRHADLAWQFVRWALESGGDGLRAIAAREFESAREGRVAVAASAETSGSDDAMLAGGILPEAWKRQVRATTIERVVLVCARALLDDAQQAAVAESA